MLYEQTIRKPKVGILRMVGDLPDGRIFRLSHIEWGEFEDLTGFIHGPLTKPQCVAVLTAQSEMAALNAIQVNAKKPLREA